MTAPHIRDLNLLLGAWHEVPKSATIPAGTRYFRTIPSGEWATATPAAPLPPHYRIPGNRYFTAEPLSDPLEAEEEIEAEAERLFKIVYAEGTWKFTLQYVRDGFRRIAAEVLDRKKKEA